MTADLDPHIAKNFPDSPGWFAFEGTIIIDPDKTMQIVCEVVDGGDNRPFYIRTVWNIYPLEHFTGTWTRLHLPWATPATPPPMPMPTAIPDDVREAIADLLEWDNRSCGGGQIIRAFLDEQQRPPAAQDAAP